MGRQRVILCTNPVHEPFPIGKCVDLGGRTAGGQDTRPRDPPRSRFIERHPAFRRRCMKRRSLGRGRAREHPEVVSRCAFFAMDPVRGTSRTAPALGAGQSGVDERRADRLNPRRNFDAQIHYSPDGTRRDGVRGLR